jgi:hypothetical protein
VIDTGTPPARRRGRRLDWRRGYAARRVGSSGGPRFERGCNRHVRGRGTGAQGRTLLPPVAGADGRRSPSRVVADASHPPSHDLGLLRDGMSPRDAAENLGVSIPTLYRWVPASSRRAVVFGGQVNPAGLRRGEWMVASSSGPAYRDVYLTRSHSPACTARQPISTVHPRWGDDPAARISSWPRISSFLAG